MKKTIIALLLCLSVFAASASALSTDGVHVERQMIVFYNDDSQWVPVKFVQNLTFGFSLSGNYMNLSEHHNAGLRQINGIPFTYDIGAAWFDWYENGSVAQHITGFPPIQVIYPPGYTPWGGRNNTSVSFYLPGNTHRAETLAVYLCSATTPPAMEHYLTYGPSRSSSVLAQTESLITVRTESPVSPSAATTTGIIESSRKVSPNHDKVNVNGLGISQKDVEFTYQLQKAYGSMQSREEVMKGQIMNRLYYQEAVRRGMLPTKAEVAAHAKNVESAMERAENRDEARMILDTLLASFEITEREYLDSCMERYERTLAICNLRATFTDEYGAFDEVGYAALGEALCSKAELVFAEGL